MATKNNESKSNQTSDLNQFLGEIKQKAHEIYLERQKENMPDDDVADWLKAEVIVKKKHNIR